MSDPCMNTSPKVHVRRMSVDVIEKLALPGEKANAWSRLLAAFMNSLDRATPSEFKAAAVQLEDYVENYTTARKEFHEALLEAMPALPTTIPVMVDMVAGIAKWEQSRNVSAKKAEPKPRAVKKSSTKKTSSPVETPVE